MKLLFHELLKDPILHLALPVRRWQIERRASIGRHALNECLGLVFQDREGKVAVTLFVGATFTSAELGELADWMDERRVAFFTERRNGSAASDSIDRLNHLGTPVDGQDAAPAIAINAPEKI